MDTNELNKALLVMADFEACFGLAVISGGPNSPLGKEGLHLCS
jgi:hypothetical protein